MSDFNNVNDLNDYYDGKNDGYMGRPMRDGDQTVAYVTGWNDGADQWDSEQSATYGEAYDDYLDDGYEWDAVSQGMYDDDPNPYSGTY